MRRERAGAPPTSLEELQARAAELRGVLVDDLAAEAGLVLPREALHQKGKLGELCEWWLGATAGSAKLHDFPQLGVELKTIPVDETLRPRETTFVCSLHLQHADRMEWASSWVRHKLEHVLWLPVISSDGAPRRFGTALLWRPTPEQEAVLRDDFDEIVGMIGAGGIESVSAHLGRWLQLRPKAQDRNDRTLVVGPEGELLETVPRGFYLRTRLTGALLRDPEALPDDE